MNSRWTVGPVPLGFQVRDSPVCGAGKSLGSKGLVSADRSEAAALLGTTPRSIPKSSTSDLASLSKRRSGFRTELPAAGLGDR